MKSIVINSKSKFNTWVYDIETYPDIFNMWVFNPYYGEAYYFEISIFMNDIEPLRRFFNLLTRHNESMTGFNNLGFDYPVIHQILTHDVEDTDSLLNLTYGKAQHIIDTSFNQRHTQRIKYPHIEQIDLYLINHFDNLAKSCSLKMCEINMGMVMVEDLPYPPRIPIETKEKMEKLGAYCLHDVRATYELLRLTEDSIKMRFELNKTYDFDYDFTNFSNAKVGETIFIDELKKNNIVLYEGRDKIQTPRDKIELNQCVLGYINKHIRTDEFKRILSLINQTTITETVGVFNGMNCTIDGLDYVFSLGGLHASRRNEIFKSCEAYQIIDIDVTAFYPSLAIANKFYPEHLGIEFINAFVTILNRRKKYKKGTSLNKALKESANASYGKSNSEFSVFYDPKYTMTTTISGQLSLAMLIEDLLDVEGLRVIQVNTDGLTYIVPKTHIPITRMMVEQWEVITGLEMEENLYKRMIIRDVNNYIAEY